MLFVILLFTSFITVLIVASNKLSNERIKAVREDVNSLRIDLRDIENRIMKMNGIEFEEFCEKLFRMDGYKTELTPSSNDNGRDIELKKDGIITFVECKHYKDSKVSSPMINKLVGSCVILGADRAIFITTSGYTKSALNLINRSPVELERWYLDDILHLCKKIGLERVLGAL